MERKRGQCTRCNKTTWNSKSGLCRKHWEEIAWGKDQEYVRIYLNGNIDGETIFNKPGFREMREGEAK